MQPRDFLETFELSCSIDEEFDALPEELRLLVEDHLQLQAHHLEDQPE